MLNQHRREFLKLLGATTICSSIGSGIPLAALAQNKNMTMEEWMDAYMSSTRTKGLDGALHVTRFVEPVYVLTKPIAWFPNDDQKLKYSRVDVPVGFVTDFASIPQIFWSALRPDGKYTYPAIVHDYLYWTQSPSVTKEMADDIFKFGMQDLGLSQVEVWALYEAVDFFGKSAWKDNTKRKQEGEKRILKVLPDKPTDSWEIWKNDKEKFL